MITIDRSRTTLLAIDFQQRLMPAIDGASDVLANAGRLIGAAKRPAHSGALPKRPGIALSAWADSGRAVVVMLKG